MAKKITESDFLQRLAVQFQYARQYRHQNGAPDGREPTMQTGQAARTDLLY